MLTRHFRHCLSQRFWNPGPMRMGTSTLIQLQRRARELAASRRNGCHGTSTTSWTELRRYDELPAGYSAAVVRKQRKMRVKPGSTTGKPRSGFSATLSDTLLNLSLINAQGTYIT